MDQSLRHRHRCLRTGALRRLFEESAERAGSTRSWGLECNLLIRTRSTFESYQRLLEYSIQSIEGRPSEELPQFRSVRSILPAQSEDHPLGQLIERNSPSVGIGERFVADDLDQVAKGQIDIVEVESPSGSEHGLNNRSSVLGPGDVRGLQPGGTARALALRAVEVWIGHPGSANGVLRGAPYSRPDGEPGNGLVGK